MEDRTINTTEGQNRKLPLADFAKEVERFHRSGLSAKELECRVISLCDCFNRRSLTENPRRRPETIS
jgi:hypothetical protein